MRMEDIKVGRVYERRATEGKEPVLRFVEEIDAGAWPMPYVRAIGRQSDDPPNLWPSGIGSPLDVFADLSTCEVPLREITTFDCPETFIARVRAARALTREAPCLAMETVLKELLDEPEHPGWNPSVQEKARLEEIALKSTSGNRTGAASAADAEFDATFTRELVLRMLRRIPAFETNDPHTICTACGETDPDPYDTAYDKDETVKGAEGLPNAKLHGGATGMLPGFRDCEESESIRCGPVVPYDPKFERHK